MLTQRLDFTADLVVNELHHRGVDLVRLDTAEFPLGLQLVAHSPGPSGRWRTYLELPDRSVALSEVGSIWYRRPAHFAFDPSLSPTECAFARQEARMGFGGLLRSVDCVWVNHPERLVSAAHKPLQLQLATEEGLEIPKTLITNNPNAAVAFWKGAMVTSFTKPWVVLSSIGTKAVWCRSTPRESAGKISARWVEFGIRPACSSNTYPRSWSSG
ncbi:MAG: MvdC/MvdD family ATP grasp protein [Egibacteraceae bacterium]